MTSIEPIKSPSFQEPMGRKEGSLPTQVASVEDVFSVLEGIANSGQSLNTTLVPIELAIASLNLLLLKNGISSPLPTPQNVQALLSSATSGSDLASKLASLASSSYGSQGLLNFNFYQNGQTLSQLMGSIGSLFGNYQGVSIGNELLMQCFAYAPGQYSDSNTQMFEQLMGGQEGVLPIPSQISNSSATSLMAFMQDWNSCLSIPGACQILSQLVSGLNINQINPLSIQNFAHLLQIWSSRPSPANYFPPLQYLMRGLNVNALSGGEDISIMQTLSIFLSNVPSQKAIISFPILSAFCGTPMNWNNLNVQVMENCVALIQLFPENCNPTSIAILLPHLLPFEILDSGTISVIQSLISAWQTDGFPNNIQQWFAKGGAADWAEELLGNYINTYPLSSDQEAKVMDILSVFQSDLFNLNVMGLLPSSLQIGDVIRAVGQLENDIGTGAPKSTIQEDIATIAGLLGRS